MLDHNTIKQSLELNNGSLTAVAKELNIKYVTLHCFVKRHKLTFNSQKKSLPSKEILEEAHNRLGSAGAVAKELGCTKDGVLAAMKRHGLATNPRKTYLSNFDFFDPKNECEEQFYWAGFIAADGCLKHRTIRGSEVYQLHIALSEKDSSHLEKFKKDIKSECPILTYLVKNSKRNSKWNDTYKSEITITNKKIFDDLARFNVVPRKTQIYTLPEWLINHKMVNHFMRGYFDGDGSFYKSLGKNKKTDQLYFSLRGTQDFLKVYRKILEDKCKLEIRDKDIRVNCSIGILEYGGNGILKSISDFLYQNSTVYLDRKHDLIKLL